MSEELKPLTLKEAENELFQIGIDKEEAAQEFKVRIEEIVGRMEPGISKHEIDAVRKYAEARAKAKVNEFVNKHEACEKVISELAGYESD